jgi:hypothetical protein
MHRAGSAPIHHDSKEERLMPDLNSAAHPDTRPAASGTDLLAALETYTAARVTAARRHDLTQTLAGPDRDAVEAEATSSLQQALARHAEIMSALDDLTRTTLHAVPDERLARADLPVVGSLVVITDPEWVEDDTAPDQLFVVSEDVEAPYYLLVRVGGGYGPQVPGSAITEIDPARISLTAVPEGTRRTGPANTTSRGSA